MRITLVVTLLAIGCAVDDGRPDLPWTGKVEAEVDNLTGRRTGLFRTYGPTQVLSAGADTIPVTIGYWCRVDGDSEPPANTDGLFFKIAMPDTTLLSNDQQAFEELSGQLGLLDVARMAVDTRVYAWQYEPQATLGGWFLNGKMGFTSPLGFETEQARDSLFGQLQEGTDGILEFPYDDELRELVDNMVTAVRESWSPPHDYVASHYMGRDTVGIELKGLLTFPMRGFAAASDSVRFWCPVVESQQNWSALRVGYFETVDSLIRATHERAAELRVVADRRAAERRAAAIAAAERAAAERAAGEQRAAAERAAAEQRAAELRAASIARAEEMRRAAELRARADSISLQTLDAIYARTTTSMSQRRLNELFVEFVRANSYGVLPLRTLGEVCRACQSMVADAKSRTLPGSGAAYGICRELCRIGR